jgi:hypothetical protein
MPTRDQHVAPEISSPLGLLAQSASQPELVRFPLTQSMVSNMSKTKHRLAHLFVLLSSCMAMAACGASSDSLGESEQPLSGDADEGAACELGVPVADGAGPSCQVVARGLCFETAAAACACAGCELAECAIAESFPTQAFCPSAQPGGSDPDGSDGDTSTSSNADAAQGGGVESSAGSSPGCAGPTTPAPGVCEGGVAQQPNTGARCDFVVDGSCFDSSAAACACAGCAADRCLILESSPAQIRCQ